MSDQQIQSQTHFKAQSFQDWAEENCRAIEKAAKFFYSRAYKLSYEECKQEALILAWKCWNKQDDTRAKLTTYYFYSVQRMWTNLARKHQGPKFKKLWNQIPISEDTGRRCRLLNQKSLNSPMMLRRLTSTSTSLPHSKGRKWIGIWAGTTQQGI